MPVSWKLTMTNCKHYWTKYRPCENSRHEDKNDLNRIYLHHLWLSGLTSSAYSPCPTAHNVQPSRCLISAAFYLIDIFRYDCGYDNEFTCSDHHHELLYATVLTRGSLAALFGDERKTSIFVYPFKPTRNWEVDGARDLRSPLWRKKIRALTHDRHVKESWQWPVCLSCSKGKHFHRSTLTGSVSR